MLHCQCGTDTLILRLLVFFFCTFDSEPKSAACASVQLIQLPSTSMCAFQSQLASHLQVCVEFILPDELCRCFHSSDHHSLLVLPNYTLRLLQRFGQQFYARPMLGINNAETANVTHLTTLHSVCLLITDFCISQMHCFSSCSTTAVAAGFVLAKGFCQLL